MEDSLVVGNGNMTTYTGLMLSYPEGMMDIALDALDDQASVNDNINKPYFFTTMPCGNNFIVQTKTDFPINDVPCSCGDSSHFFIKHQIQKGIN